jgi:hypothetical protein
MDPAYLAQVLIGAAKPAVIGLSLWCGSPCTRCTTRLFAMQEATDACEYWHGQRAGTRDGLVSIIRGI